MTKNIAKNSTRFTVDFLNKKIVGTKASFNKASKGISPIYEELTMKINAHPSFELVVKEQKKKSNKVKRDYNGMDYTFIEEYISIQKNADKIMSEYKAVKAFYTEQKVSVYPKVKKWFFGKFDPDNEGFDMEKAKQEISDAEMAEAVLSAEPATTEEIGEVA